MTTKGQEILDKLMPQDELLKFVRKTEREFVELTWGAQGKSHDEIEEEIARRIKQFDDAIAAVAKMTQADINEAVEKLKKDEVCSPSPK